VPLASLEEWLDSVEYPATVAFTVIGTGYAVSTIFLGLVRQINQWFTAFPSSN
jgi:hypothetical protein